MNTRVGWAGLVVCGVMSTTFGCGSGSDSAGAGGASNGGASGASARGGAAAITPIGDTCRGGVTAPPVSALLTDFSDATPDAAHAGEYRFGGVDAARVQGGTARFFDAAPNKGTLTLSEGKLGFSATVAAPAASGPGQFPYSGFVLAVDGPACIDANAYKGVSFELAGDLGDCILYLSFAYADDLATTADPARGLCIGTCYPSEFAITPSNASVHFSDAPTVPGVPVADVNTSKLIGVQWQIAPTGTTSCSAAFTVANVRFE